MSCRVVKNLELIYNYFIPFAIELIDKFFFVSFKMISKEEIKT
jgi:hypothetical protein